MKPSIDAKGFDELIQNLNKLGNKAHAVEKEAMVKAGEHLQNEIKQVAPADLDNTPENVKYGTLKDNISMKYSPAKQAVVVDTGDAYWSIFLEYGTRKMNKKPFMEQTLNANRDEMRNIMADVLKKGMGLS